MGAHLKTTLVSLAILLAFIGGFGIGRAFPTHHYQRWGEGPYVFDTTTGRMCDPSPTPKPDPFDVFDPENTPLTHKRSDIPHCESVW